MTDAETVEAIRTKLTLGRELNRIERYIIADCLENWPEKMNVVAALNALRTEIELLRKTIETRPPL